VNGNDFGSADDEGLTLTVRAISRILVLMLYLASCVSATPAVISPAPRTVAPTANAHEVTHIPLFAPSPIEQITTPSIQLVPFRPSETNIPSPEVAVSPQPPQEADIDEIHMSTPDVGWAVASTRPVGSILRTTDGGLTWRSITPPQKFTGDDLFNPPYPKAFFLDAFHAWVLFTGDNKTLWRTSDGGVTWEPSSKTFFSSPSLMFFLNPSTGWLLTFVGAITGGGVATNLYRTLDGGATWDTLVHYYDSFLNCPISGMVFADASYGWIAASCLDISSQASILVTSDGGTTWQELKLPAPDQDPKLFEQPPGGCYEYELSFPSLFSTTSGAVVLSCGGRVGNEILMKNGPPDYLYRTSDGGQTWQTSVIPTEYIADLNDPYLSLAFSELTYINEQSLWLVIYAEQGFHIFHSNDRGITWTPIKAISWTGRAFIVNDGLAFAKAIPASGTPSPGESKLVRSSDGCRTWEIINPTFVP
jgi:photosystem II stability/assembly factor-like uncharacterized protein